jgi:hypothetical protein
MLNVPPPSWDRRHGEAASPIGKPPPRFSQMRRLGTSLHSKRSGSWWWTSPPLRPRPRSWPLHPAEERLGRGHRAKIPKHIISAHRRWVGHDVLSTGKNPRHRCCVASGMARWCRTDSTPHSARVGTSRQRSDTMPSAMKLAPSPPADFSSRATLWPRQGWRNKPQAHCQPYQDSHKRVA